MLETLHHSLAYFNRDEGETVLAYVISKINNAVKSFNVGVPMTPAQIGECAKRIYERYHYLEPEEVETICKNAVMGDYGQPIRVNEAFVNEWFFKYDEMRRNKQPETIEEADEETRQEFYSRFAQGPTGSKKLEKMPPVMSKRKYTPSPISEKQKFIREWLDLEDKGRQTMEQYVNQKLRK